MTDRDRLIELFKKIEYTPFPEMTMESNLGNQFTEYALNCIVDELLANGVILPPCKVGQEVYTNASMQGWYFRSNDKPYRAKIIFMGINNSEEMGGGFINIAYENRGYMLQFNFSDIGKTVFLTKEEAEEKLKELNK